VIAMPYRALDGPQQLAAARVTELTEKYDPQTPRDEARAALRAAGGDPVVLGEVLGDYLHRIVDGRQAETVRYWPVLDLLRGAGADEDVARERALWLRQNADVPDRSESAG
jgi:hypothetical protein